MSTSTTAPLLRVRGIRREFAAGEQTLVVLDGVDLDIHAGELVAIVGQSGSGKSTLMNILGCLDRPSAGAYQIAGRETAQMSPDELAELRREHFGFIFQRYHLLTDLTALGNVEVPAIYAAWRGPPAAPARRAVGAAGPERTYAASAWRAVRWPAAACFDCARTDERRRGDLRR